jgi:uncharacterized cupredoxin-like copper-binding protein
MKVEGFAMKFRSIAVVVLMVLTVSIMLSACGGGSSTPAPSTGTRTIAVDAAEFAFTPNKFDAKVGDKLTFKITDKGTVDHSFVITGPDGVVITRTDVKLGSPASLDFTPTKAGAYQISCDVPGHKDAGMVGTLTVTP